MDTDDGVESVGLTGLFSQLLTGSQRRQCQLPDLLGQKDGVVLVGAGKVGQDFLGALTASHIPVFVFTDNNPAKWGQTVSGLDVLSPPDAVRRFGGRAVFLITIGRIGTAAAEVCRQFSNLGVGSVLHFSEAIQFIPRIWPHFFLAPDAFTEGDLDSCAAAFGLFQEARSRDLFVAHLRWRVTLDATTLPTPDYDNQYFPPEFISPRHCATFVDVGAYTGDSLLALSRFAGNSLQTYYGFEPDPSNYDRLIAQVAAITDRQKPVRFVTKRIAIGSTDRQVSFSSDGSTTSQVNPNGLEQVQSSPLDTIGVAHPTYVKIDVEGAEADVLLGATETLRRWKPTVAIATYHRPKDLFDLPLWLALNIPDCRFYLRSHGDAGIDLVCYAVREPMVA